MSQEAILLEIKSQIIQCDLKLEKEDLVSNYVNVLNQKRQWEELLKQEQLKKKTDETNQD